MKTYERDDKIYAVPLGFSIPAVQGEESLVNAAESLKTLAEEISSIREENPDLGRVMIPTDSEMLLEIFYRLESTDLKKRTALWMKRR